MNIEPWGRSFNEYQRMFLLTEDDLKKRILGSGDGPASFNAELTKMGCNIVSIDPIYQFSREQIRSRIKEAYPQIMSQVGNHKGNFIWESVGGIEELGRIRMDAMERFLDDYEVGKAIGRYVNAQLPVLPFDNNEFDLALCSHYLFLYSEHVNEDEHILSMKELCRVASEVRVYPLLSLDGKRSRHLEPTTSALVEAGIDVSLKRVGYQFQKGATEMLVAKST